MRMRFTIIAVAVAVFVVLAVAVVRAPSQNVYYAGDVDYLFVYNVDADPISVVKDAIHKIVAPQTYPCNLCGLTYGWFTEKSRWRAFVNQRPESFAFLHRDQFRARFPARAGDPLPAVYRADDDGSLELVIPAEDINSAQTLDELISLTRQRLAR